MLQLPSSDGIAPASTLLVRAQASIDLTAPSIDVSLSFTGDLVNALGMQGLTLRDLGIQVGVNFASPIPIPTLGIGATVARLPDDIAKMLGVQNDPAEPMRFVANISPTKPIFELTLGVADGHTFLKPVQPISDAHKEALTIDYASLVFAPLGGDVPPYHYEPGISVGFAGSAMGVPVSGSARITLSPPNLHADLDVGEIVLGSGAAATRIRATHLLLDVTPTNVLVEASGGIAIPGGPDAAVELRVAAALLPPSASATFKLDVNNWNLPFPGASVKELHAEANLGVSFGSLPSGSLAVNALRPRRHHRRHGHRRRHVDQRTARLDERRRQRVGLCSRWRHLRRSRLSHRAYQRCLHQRGLQCRTVATVVDRRGRVRGRRRPQRQPGGVVRPHRTARQRIAASPDARKSDRHRRSLVRELAAGRDRPRR